MEDNSNVFDFYNGGAEIGRLERGLGVVEFYRTKEIITQYLGESKLKICDIGGGIGRYSEWLAEMGHDVTMIELAPSAVEYAKKEMKTPYIAKAGDARNIDEEDSSFDVVLLMGPLYHLMNRSDRMLGRRCIRVFCSPHMLPCVASGIRNRTHRHLIIPTTAA